jgi:hypothetical protein
MKMTEVLEQSIGRGRILQGPSGFEGLERPSRPESSLDQVEGFQANLRATVRPVEVHPELNEDFFFARLFQSHYITATTKQVRVRSAIGGDMADSDNPPVYDSPAAITFGGKINRCAVSNDGNMLAVSVGDVLSIYSMRMSGEGLHLKPIASYPFADFDVEGGNISFSQDRSELFAYTSSGINGRFPVETHNADPEFKAA